MNKFYFWCFSGKVTGIMEKACWVLVVIIANWAVSYYRFLVDRKYNLRNWKWNYSENVSE